jgi:hypothetical protein
MLVSFFMNAKTAKPYCAQKEAIAAYIVRMALLNARQCRKMVIAIADFIG